MCHDLMAEQVEIDPGVAATSLRAAKYHMIEMARLFQIIYRKSHMKRCEHFQKP
jgi:hypothetical protein